MGDRIQLLPDHLANKIAAGEVIQRPASAVKELLENAVDAHASHIQLIIQEAGKSLIQVIDNGSGMSENDARMCFERHATSKINEIEDLFRIRTMGFRGEALASIAAVAQVELKTKRAEDPAGTLIEVENSTVTRQEPVAMVNGTSIAMKNIFFNIPARRNFLKTNAVELRHIVDEFMRVAMAFPEIVFSLTSNGQQVFHLEKGTLKQRIIQLLGSGYASKLVTVQEKTDYLNIYGFAGKPEASKKTRGDQYLFVNNRFIRSPYLHHAIVRAYQDLISADSFPFYVLFIELDPAQVDVNVHPTKQEIKFEDDKIIYAFVQAAIKHALAQFSITPTLEFDLDPQIQHLDAVSKPFSRDKQDAALTSALFQSFTQRYQAHAIDPGKQGGMAPYPGGSKSDTDERFESLIDQLDARSRIVQQDGPLQNAVQASRVVLDADLDGECLQLHGSFLLLPTHRGYILIHQQQAHEQVLYEKYSLAASHKEIARQQSLFPVTLQFSTQDALLLTDLLPELLRLGYQIESFGKDAFLIQGIPADLAPGDERNTIERVLDDYKHFPSELHLDKREKLIRSLAMQHSIKSGKRLSKEEMKNLAQQLFACQRPQATPSGKPTYVEFKLEQLMKMFVRSENK